MNARQLLFRDDARHRILRGVSLLADAVKEVLGPPAVLDPCKATRSALQNAAAVAGLILTTDCMVADLSQTSAGLQAGEEM